MEQAQLHATYAKVLEILKGMTIAESQGVLNAVQQYIGSLKLDIKEPTPDETTKTISE